MQVDEAGDGREAMFYALSRHFDIVFMDVRLPQGNGLDLTKAIKILSADTVVCVITSYDILEYREAAFHNGADHYMVKGDSSEADIVDLVESLLHTHFVSLIVANDELSRRQINILLTLRWPAMVVAEACDVIKGLGYVTALKPDLVLFELGLGGINNRILVRNIRARSPHATLIGLVDEENLISRGMARECGVDYCVPLAPMGHTEMMAIVDSLQPKPTRH